jgi:hypothetical protein
MRNRLDDLSPELEFNLLNRLFQPNAETLLCSSIGELSISGRLENLQRFGRGKSHQTVESFLSNALC